MFFVANLKSIKDFKELKDSLMEAFSKKNLPVQDHFIGVTKKFGVLDLSSVEEVVKVNSPAEKSKNAENRKEREARILFVKNLPYRIGVNELQEMFGNAKDIRLPFVRNGLNKGVAYVEFSTEAEADAAIQNMQGTEIDGRPMLIDYTGVKNQLAKSGRVSVGVVSEVLLVKNLAFRATKDQLREVFEKATSIKIKKTKQGKHNGNALVKFSSAKEAKEALESCNDTEIEGRAIQIEFCLGHASQGVKGSTKLKSAQLKTLLVNGLSEDTTKETLKEAFNGSVSARIAKDRDTGASLGFGFVEFSTNEDAKAANEAMKNGKIDGKKVTLKFAKPKEDSSKVGCAAFGGKRGGAHAELGGKRGGAHAAFGDKRGGGRGAFGGKRGAGRGAFGRRGGACMSGTAGPL
ncbi:hypothetical protein GDO78_005067 [Eleutherodactylus coqui]|uniref:RRM domain-containing protein n=1 Tax=Eleutherodactylus coqui TaxID=57060 RepID=A0A8J6KDF5_ELECQ|nr:hypothetical protein GDO78_005067 [Eleutherodactylus coqui]